MTDKKEMLANLETEINDMDPKISRVDEVKAKLLVDYCGACANLHFCFPELFEPGTQGELRGSEAYVTSCKALFNAHLLRGGMHD